MVLVENYKSWWKEEDIQSYFYHILISNIENGIGLVHRKYPLYRSNLDLNHFRDFHIGNIDLVILDKPWEMNIWDCRIAKAFELKFPRDIKVGYSEWLKVIDVSTIDLLDTILVDTSAPATVGDYDSDGISDLMVKFVRTDVVDHLGTEDVTEDVTEDETGTDYEELTITGKLTDETPFGGSDTIRVIDKGKSK